MRSHAHTRVFVCDRLQATWNQFVGAGMADLMTQVQPHARKVAAWLGSQAGSCLT